MPQTASVSGYPGSADAGGGTVPARRQDYEGLSEITAARIHTARTDLRLRRRTRTHLFFKAPLSAESYVQMLAAASAAIREVCPFMRIISGVPMPAANAANLIVDDFAYTQRMLEVGMANHVDGIDVHPSGYNVLPHATWQETCVAI